MPSGGVPLPYVMGGNRIKMRTLAGATDPVLPAGDYTLTLAQSNFGDLLRSALNLGPQPTLNASREQYQIPTHRGLDLHIPFPLTSDSDGQVLEGVSTHILPQLSLHTSGGPLTGNPVMATGLVRVIEVAQRIINGEASRGVAHASSGPALQQNLLCVLEGDN